MNYSETLDYLYTQLPMFQRIGSEAYKANLDNTLTICELLGNPEKKFESIHIAGTNGKGSTSHFIASILQSAGLKVGLYTSPHLKDFRERIKINGKMIPEQYVVDFVEKHKNNFEKIQPSFFEMTVGLAFDYFASQKVDIAIIEVGLGGRLDSTNVISPLCSVITNISLDHSAILGNTLEKIAQEKAGIIKSKTPVIIGESQGVTKNIFIEKAKLNDATILFADERYKAFNVGHIHHDKLFLAMDILGPEQTVCYHLESELLGLYQQKNIPAVLSVIDLLNDLGFDVSKKNVMEGIKNVVTQTGLLGRWQVLSESPFVVADCGHNEAGIKEVVDQIIATPHRHLHFVLGMVNDKDISTILGLLPKEADYYFCKADIPRALNADELAKQAQKTGLQGQIYESVNAALRAAKKEAHPNDLVMVGGSTFTVAEVV